MLGTDPKGLLFCTAGRRRRRRREGLWLGTVAGESSVGIERCAERKEPRSSLHPKLEDLLLEVHPRVLGAVDGERGEQAGVHPVDLLIGKVLLFVKPPGLL